MQKYLGVFSFRCLCDQLCVALVHACVLCLHIWIGPCQEQVGTIQWCSGFMTSTLPVCVYSLEFADHSLRKSISKGACPANRNNSWVCLPEDHCAAADSPHSTLNVPVHGKSGNEESVKLWLQMSPFAYLQV